MADKGYYSFISFLRNGIANSIKDVIDPSKDPNNLSGINARAGIDFTVNVKFNDASEALPLKKIELYGPGDVIGIDHRVVIRTEPRNYNTNFEPNYLASVEFYDEDFPWRFTPTVINDDKRKLTPWLTLVVLSEDEVVPDDKNKSNTTAGKPLPTFILEDGANRSDIFPESKNLWAWAHVHVNEDIVNSAVAEGKFNDSIVQGKLGTLLDEDGDYCYSRLICPRRLAPNKSYHAFLIPTFEAGRLAGVGNSSEIENTPVNKIAWSDPGEKEFPYYYRWYFSTGAMGDFEYLVTQIKKKPADTRIGFRDMDVYFEKNNAEEVMTLKLPGALRVPLDTLPSDKKQEVQNYENWEGGTSPHDWQKNIADKLRLHFDGDEPVITMPVYGQWHAKVDEILFKKGTTNTLLAPAKRNDWVHELNLDPRYRAVAALGTKVIQKNQEELMDAAWEQVDKIREANRKINFNQLAIKINETITRNVLSRFSSEQLLGFTVPLHSKMISGVGASYTITKKIDDSPVQNVTQSNLFRKAARNTGRIAKIGGNARHIFAASPGKDINVKFNLLADKQFPKGAVGVKQFEAIFTDYILKQPGFKNSSLADQKKMQTGIQSALKSESSFLVSLKTRTAALNFTSVESVFKLKIKTTAPPQAPAVRGLRTVSTGAGLSLAAGTTVTAFNTGNVSFAKQLGATMENTKIVYDFQKEVVAEPQIPLNLKESKTAILSNVNAKKVLTNQLYKAFPGLKGITIDKINVIDRVMAYPIFNLPMYLPLNELSNEYFLPNINLLEQNSMTLLETNQRFIESYMAGLNHEMSRELLWRGFPTDQRGSYFRKFWDSVSDSYKDINEIHTWNKNLGENGDGGNSGLLVLVIRGDLLKKYPTTVIYAQKADWDGNVNKNRVLKAGSVPVMPLFETKVEPDIYFFGFKLNEKDLIGQIDPKPTKISDDPGWFFVLEERPGEPRFGFDSNVTSSKKDWGDISWQDIKINEGKIITFDTGATTAFMKANDEVQASWPPKDSAQAAYILYQQPVRMAVHASRLLIQDFNLK